MFLCRVVFLKKGNGQAKRARDTGLHTLGLEVTPEPIKHKLEGTPPAYAHKEAAKSQGKFERCA